MSNPSVDKFRLLTTNNIIRRPAAMSDPTKRPASRDKRTRSAKARLTPPGPDRAYDQQHVLKAARERVKSAKAIREKHEGSTKIFPRPPLRPSKERFTSIYSKDFEGTYIPPADLRPSSPTRRNNPHPGKVSWDYIYCRCMHAYSLTLCSL